MLGMEYLASLNEPMCGFDHFIWRGVVQNIGDYARCHDSDVGIEEVRIGGEGCDERDCSRFLREILSHGG